MWEESYRLPEALRISKSNEPVCPSHNGRISMTKLPYSNCHCKIGQLPRETVDKIDEQIIIGTPYSIIINGFPAHNLKATDLSYHKKNCQIVKVLQEEQPEIPITPLELPSEAEAISDLKRIVAMRIGHLTRQTNLTPILNNQLTSLIDLQRKLLESPA